MNEQYVLWGSAGHAKVLDELIRSRGGRVVALFDNDPLAVAAIESVPLYIGKAGFFNWLEQQRSHKIKGVVAIGGAMSADRLRIQEIFIENGINVVLTIHPKAFVADTAIIGRGSQVLANAVVSASVQIGVGCIVNHGAIIDHECVLGDGVHIAPRATLCGCVRVGSGVFIGAGAVILPRVTIGSGATIGAGAVVRNDVSSGATAVGVPASIL